MFGIGVPELMLILVVGLVVFGPAKLPEIGRALGKTIGEFKKLSNSITVEPIKADPPQRKKHLLLRMLEVIIKWIDYILLEVYDMFGLGVPELILILVIGLVVFGAGRLPEIGRALGKSISEFKAAGSEDNTLNITSESNKEEQK